MLPTGASEKTLTQLGDTDFEKIYLYPNSHAGYYPGAKYIATKVLFRKTDGLLLGAQMLGEDGVPSRINAFAMAIQAGLTVYDLEESELAYAPPFGSAKDPVNFAGMVAVDILRDDMPICHWAAVDNGLLLDVRQPAELKVEQVAGRSQHPAVGTAQPPGRTPPRPRDSRLLPLRPACVLRDAHPAAEWVQGAQHRRWYVGTLASCWMKRRKFSMLLTKSEVAPGDPYPLGATPRADGVNFSLYANKAEAIELLLFDRVDAPPAQVIRLTPVRHRTYHYWHTFVPKLQPGQIYAYRAIGPNAPERGLRFDPEKVLLDPYGRAVAMPANYDRAAASRPGDNAVTAMKSVVVDSSAYDWEGDRPLRRSFAATVCYEMHVGGFTRHPNSGVAADKRGTYAGLVEKIPYLQDLGITAVELLPVYQFDPQTAPPGLVNYWGYQPISFFAPHTAYSARQAPLAVLDEFRDMVKALHKAGIEVILDVVYNHTAEAFGEGATMSFRGLANDTYYVLDPADKSRYADYTGCGNTLNAGHTVVRRLILDSLRYWAQEMHIDGFRFDLAAVLARGEHGEPLASPPVIWDIEADPALAGVKLIAEAWDAAGLYQVGSFVGDAWKEWNGKFRDDVRSFLKSDDGRVTALTHRLTGSPDIYAQDVREPEQSVNFVTVHDGFTLNDLVSYNEKHNEANGEENRDGANDNYSWNCGVEGPTDDPAIEALRNRQVKNFFTLLLLSVGAPLINMGDEVRRTQQGNNNGYCQDNEISWFDWSLVDKHADVYRFVKELIAARLSFGQGRTDTDILVDLLRRVHFRFYDINLNPADEGLTSHSLAVARDSANGAVQFFLMINAYWEPLTFHTPLRDPGEHGWRLWIDTSQPSSHDIHNWDDAPLLTDPVYTVGPRAIVVLAAA